MYVQIVLCIAVRFGVMFVHNVSKYVSKSFPPLNTKPHAMSIGDITCLGMNMVIETAFTVWLFNYNLVFISPFFPFNVLLLLVCDDLLYAPYHHLLHHRMFYKWIHFRHHKISHPSESHMHASMEHPFEMIGALLLHATMIRAFSPLLDRVSLLTHVFIKGLGACLNHSGRDVQWLGYKTKYHHLHHMHRKCNFSQYIFLYDMVVGTFCET